MARSFRSHTRRAAALRREDPALCSMAPIHGNLPEDAGKILRWRWLLRGSCCRRRLQRLQHPRELARARRLHCIDGILRTGGGVRLARRRRLGAGRRRRIHLLQRCEQVVISRSTRRSGDGSEDPGRTRRRWVPGLLTAVRIRIIEGDLLLVHALPPSSQVSRAQDPQRTWR